MDEIVERRWRRLVVRRHFGKPEKPTADWRRSRHSWKQTPPKTREFKGPGHATVVMGKERIGGGVALQEKKDDARVLH